MKTRRVSFEEPLYLLRVVRQYSNPHGGEEASQEDTMPPGGGGGGSSPLFLRGGYHLPPDGP